MQAIGRARDRLFERLITWLDGLWQPPPPEPYRRKRRSPAHPLKVHPPLTLPAPTHKEHRTIQ